MKFRPRRWLAALLLLALLAGAGVLAFLQREGITPRALAPYVERRSDGHNPLIMDIGKSLYAILTRLDRGEGALALAAPLTIGAQPKGPAAPAVGNEILVDSAEQARKVLAAALPGDVVTFMPGDYYFRGGIKLSRGGTPEAPITVRAREPGSVRIELYAEEGFKVHSPYWTFENLHLRGVCPNHTDCEHAFHVFGKAVGFKALNNTILDFNAHFKVNGLSGVFPDNGLIEGNTLSNTAIRNTTNPVVPIDIVAASNWIIRRNLITDFIKGNGNRVSYGAFAKGNGSGTVFEQNIVLCEQRLRSRKGQRVGLSLGGGGSGGVFCRDRRCITEQDDGVIRNNFIAHCSDAGIYLNSAARSQVHHNTLIDTGGVESRFATTSADLEGNLIDGGLRRRDGAILRDLDNRSTSLAWLYLGLHPNRSLLRDALGADYAFDGEPPRRDSAGAVPAGPDLCGKPRSPQPAYGAFEDFGACLSRR